MDYRKLLVDERERSSLSKLTTGLDRPETFFGLESMCRRPIKILILFEVVWLTFSSKYATLFRENAKYNYSFVNATEKLYHTYSTIMY